MKLLPGDRREERTEEHLIKRCTRGRSKIQSEQRKFIQMRADRTWETWEFLQLKREQIHI